MTTKTSDLSALSRAPTGERPATAVPMPSRKLGTRVILPVVGLLATAGLVAFAAGDALWPAVPVRVAPVVARADVSAAAEGSVVVQAPGWVEADPFAVSVSTLTDGVIEEVLVLEGERVEAGQVVARLVSIDAELALQHAKATVQQRTAELESARAALTAAQQSWKSPIELTRELETAEAQLAEKRAELDRWPAELAREEAHGVYLKAEHERLEPLHERGQASDIETVQAEQAYLSQQATVEATRKRKAVLEAQLAEIEAKVRAAQEDLRLRIEDAWALAEARAVVARSEAALSAARAIQAEAELRLERTDVRAAAGGVVMTRLVEPGAKLMLNADNPRSAQVVRLYDPQKLQVRVDVPLVEAAKVGVRQEAEVIVDVLPDRVFRGEVTRVVHEADVQKNTLQVKVAILDPVSELKPEMLARARFLATGTEASGEDARMERLFVPEEAIRESDGDTWVWLADQAENVARQQTVELGRAKIEGAVEVQQGLQVGDRVVISSEGQLSDGERIRIVGEAN